MPERGLRVLLLSEDGMPADDHRELNVLLVVDGIVHDPSGRRPPERLELRLSSKALADLGAQIKAFQQAQFVQARVRAEREGEDPQQGQAECERAAEVATDSSRVDTGVLQRIVVALHERDSGPTQPPEPPRRA
ncbi:hypothetical protein [Streptomyces sp. NBC_01803]|uniref:hypothetical protein n=1 Tax=Streptomyces sp. NBC_01803 TaxID=2975946 RepID=UPI002DDB77D6|nr:hypothetical protein [Streptomyces sp. NBC_01803]WSA46384.1 hypothetical protein OIE51_20655 [Streptomyces sp. NBC_01803]